MSLCLAACTTMIRVQEAPRERPIRVQDSLPVRIVPPSFALESGSVVGGQSPNPNRPYSLVHTWQGTFDVEPKQFRFPLRDELSSHGYRSATGGQPAFRLQSTVTRLVYNLFGSDPRAGWTEAEVTVQWELVGTKTITVTTRGSGDARPHSLASLFTAMRNSMRAFLARPDVAAMLVPPGFQAQPKPAIVPAPTPLPKPVLVPPAPGPLPGAPGARLIPRPPVSASALSDSNLVARGQRGVVTVLAGDGWASGVVLTADGLIATQAAAVGHAASVSVVSHNGSEHAARVVVSKPEIGLALLDAEGGGYSALRLGWDAGEMGGPVLVLGTPFHPALSFSVSRGRLTGRGGGRLATDARVSAGNAGGPMLDPRGRVIGLVVWQPGTAGNSTMATGVPARDAMAALGLTYGN